MSLNNGAIVNEVESRLEELFGDEQEVQKKVADESQSEPYHLRVLKTIVLSIDWEINDGVMTRFIEQVGRLRGKYRSDKAVVLLLQILDFLGRYIKLNKSKAHPDAIKVLNSVYAALETTISSKGLTPVERKKILLEEVKKFNALKQYISSAALNMDETKNQTGRPANRSQNVPNTQKNLSAEGKTGNKDSVKPKSIPVDQVKAIPPEALLAAMQEIKQVIRDEMEILKREIISAVKHR